MIEITNLGTVTCYAIIIAMGVIIFKALSYPLSNMFNALNPFLRYRLIKELIERINDLEMAKFMYEDDIKNLQNEIKSLKSNSRKK
jgi:sensor histidine kinase YesM